MALNYSTHLFVEGNLEEELRGELLSESELHRHRQGAKRLLHNSEQQALTTKRIHNAKHLCLHNISQSFCKVSMRNKNSFILNFLLLAKLNNVLRRHMLVRGL